MQSGSVILGTVLPQRRRWFLASWDAFGCGRWDDRHDVVL